MSNDKLKIQILCVDDESEILQIHKEALASLGYEILLSSNGQEAFQLIEKHSETLGMVISDYSMPGWSGFDLRKAMLENYKQIPFLLISAHISREEALRAIELKLTGFLEKPYEKGAFLELIQKEIRDRISSIQDDHEMLQGFIVEADGMLEEMESLTLSLEENPNDKDAIDRIFACAHTIKGTSGFFKPEYAHRFTHRFEDYLSIFKKQHQAIGSVQISVILKALDTIKKLIALLRDRDRETQDIEELSKIFTVVAEKNAGPTEKKQEQKNTGKGYQKGPDELKVEVALLDRFMEMSGEITVLRNMVNKVIKVVESAHPGDQNVAVLGELLSEMHKVNTSMQNQVLDLRKVPLKQTFKPLIRTLRDLNTQLNKNIQFEISGEELKVDHSIAEILNKCLIHLLRNSADHGIEKEGKISLKAEEKNDSIIVKLADNGRGINSEVVKRKSLEKGLITAAQADLMSRSEIQMLIFEPGFSTAEQVTDVSGRGVGTDMVKKTIEAGNGRIELNSEVGQGTEFQLHLPIPKSVMIISSLLVKSGGLTFAIPQDEILRVNLMDPDFVLKNIRKVAGTTFLEENGNLIPIVNLSDLYQLDLESENSSNLIMISNKGYTYCLLVEEVLETEDIVVKKLGNWFTHLKLYHGATFLGDGKIGLILNTEFIISRFEDKSIKKSIQEKAIIQEIKVEDELNSLLVFDVGSNHLLGIEQNEIFRLELFSLSDIQFTGKQPVTIYRDQTIPLFDLYSLLEKNPNKNSFQKFGESGLLTIVYESKNHYIGFVVKSILDFVRTPVKMEKHLHPYIVDERTITYVQMATLIANLEFRGRDDTQPSIPGTALSL